MGLQHILSAINPYKTLFINTLHYQISAFDGSLGPFDINLTIKHLTFWCKPTVSEYLFNVYLIEELNLRGRLAPQ